MNRLLSLLLLLLIFLAMSRDFKQDARNKKRRQKYAQKKASKEFQKTVESSVKRSLRRNKSDYSNRNEAQKRARLNDVPDYMQSSQKKEQLSFFEKSCQAIKHVVCKCCHSVRLSSNMKIISKGKNKGSCKKCAKLKDQQHFLKEKMLPVWYKHGVAQFRLPDCLTKLHHAEKMIIQRLSAFVPLHHLVKGTFGLKGHCCAFQQDIGEFLNRLPRQKDDTSLLRVMQSIRAEIGSDKASSKEFKVRRKEVIEALEFLQEHSTEYKDIEIDPSALDWIDGDEAYLEGHDIILEEEEKIINEADASNKKVQTDTYTDRGPAPNQTNDPKDNDEYVKPFGYVDEGAIGDISIEDKDISVNLKETIKKSTKKKDIVVDWPAVDALPVSEFGNTKIFANAFPWLFPGGIGDIKDYDGDMKDWGKMLLFYEDGRFAKDKIFCFFALNYIVRQRNSSGGKYFIDTFQANCPDTLEELQQDIQKGNTNFVNSLTYYSRRIKGSSPYWKSKRAEAYSWVNFHAQKGHGAPNFFITLSCAEYYWPDVIDLLRERMEMAGEDSSECYVGSPKLVRIANEYSIVIQEYFQERVKIWLNTVGKEIFGIKYYWCRYEFAPGRGQIHAHLLAIAGDQTPYQHAYQLSLPKDTGEQARANYLATWAKNKFGLTATVDQHFDDIKDDKENSPVSVRFQDVNGTDESIYNDSQHLLKAVQYHECSGFCLKKHEKRQNRTCRAGAGQEKTKDQADTPGFPLCSEPHIKVDHKHSRKLYMPRNHPRVNQSSLDMLQSWRGNCDVQLLIYNSDPKYPDLNEIARVTDYVVAYSCKGNFTHLEEIQQNKAVIMRAEDITGDKSSVIRAAKQVMNEALKKRMISKQECMVLLADLDLVLCSETISNVSISSSKRLRKAEGKETNSSFVEQYTNRSDGLSHLNMNDYYHHIHNSNSYDKTKIPNFVGVNGSPCFPVTESYARQVLIVYQPWRLYPRDRPWLPEFESFINSAECPTEAKIPYRRVFLRYINKMTYYDPKADNPDYSNNPMSDEDRELIDLCGLSASDDVDFDTAILKSMPKGIDHDWDRKPKERELSEEDKDTDPSEWLIKKITTFEDECNNTLQIPLREDGSEYTIDMLKPDQQEIFIKIMSKLNEWLTTEDLSKFKPLRMVINGSGGSGKSVVINTVVTYMRRMFENNEVVRVAAPTGTAAYNVGGETFHHMLNMKVSKKEYVADTLTPKNRLNLVKKFKCLLALIIDERSLVNSKDLGTTEQYIRETIYQGGPLQHMNNLSWGGLPIVIMVGDDYQLPGVTEGALNALTSTNGGKMTFKGRKAMIECAKYVMELKTSKRVQKDKQEDAKLLSRLRTGEDISDADVNRLLSLHVDAIQAKHGKEKVAEIEKESIHLFYKNEKRIRHNFQRIAQECSTTNPVAIIKPHCTSTVAPKGVKRHFESDTPATSLLCIGARVALENRNFCPVWGLHNGACGMVQEMVFKKGENPNTGHLPQYVVVEFPLYCGPPWDHANPKCIPIPVTEFCCKHSCCHRRFLPLTLAYARTIHKFQGLSAGPTEEGRPDNMYKCIVCDPDDKKWEGNAIGLLYTAASRATTLGDKDGLNSAIYFTGSDFKKGRIFNLYKLKGTDEDFKLAMKRKRWVHFINRHTDRSKLTDSTKRDIIRWCKTSHFSYDELSNRIDNYVTEKQRRHR